MNILPASSQLHRDRKVSTSTDSQDLPAEKARVTLLAALDRKRRRRETVLRVVLPTALGVVAALLWQGWASIRQIVVLPTFSATARAVPVLLADGAFWHSLAISDQAIGIAFPLAAFTGITLGMAMGRWKRVSRPMDVYVNIMLVVPMAILLPIVLMALGLTLRARVAVIFLFAMPFILVPVRSGMKVITKDLVEVSKSFGAREWQLWRHIFLPGVRPSAMLGLRQGFAHAFTGMLVVELTLLAAGIGGYILKLQSGLEYDRIFALVFLIIVQALIGIGLLQWLEIKLRPKGRS